MDLSEELQKMLTIMTHLTERIFDTDPFTLSNAIVDYLNAVDPNEEERWCIGDIKFTEKGGEN